MPLNLYCKFKLYLFYILIEALQWSASLRTSWLLWVICRTQCLSYPGSILRIVDVQLCLDIAIYYIPCFDLNLNVSLCWVLSSPVFRGPILGLGSVSRDKELGNSGVTAAPSKANSYSTWWNICSLEELSKLNSVLKLPVHYHSGCCCCLFH